MKRRGGYTLVELVLVLMLLTFVAVSVFLLTDRGSAAYTRLAAGRDQAADLRIALSYMDVRLKRIDGNGSVTLRPAPFGGGQALVLTQPVEGVDYETQLYVDGGLLRELFVKKGQAVTADMASEIARADSLQIHFASESLLAVTLTRGAALPEASAAAAPAGSSDAPASSGAAASPDVNEGVRATQWVYLRAGLGVQP